MKAFNPSIEKYPYMAYSEGTPSIRVRLGEKIIEKYIDRRGAVPDDGITDKVAEYATILHTDPVKLRKKLLMLLSHKLCDEIYLFNSVIGEINKSIGSDLGKIKRDELVDLFSETQDGISPASSCLSIKELMDDGTVKESNTKGE